MQTQTIAKGTGYRPDPKGHTYNGFHLLRASKASAPDEFSLLPYIPKRYDQVGTSSCTGHGTGGAIATTFSALGKPLRSRPRARIIYTLGRAIDRINVRAPLIDDGAMPNSVIRALALWGIALEDDTDGGRTADSPDYGPYLEQHVNDELRLGELEQCIKMPLLGFNAITASGQEKLTQMRQAISGRHAIMFGVAAGNNQFQGFRDPNGTKVLDFCGTDFDHWVFAAAYRMNVKREMEALLVNSWNLNWGWNGMAWVSQRFLTEGTESVLVCNLG